MDIPVHGEIFLEGKSYSLGFGYFPVRPAQTYRAGHPWAVGAVSNASRNCICTKAPLACALELIGGDSVVGLSRWNSRGFANGKHLANC